MSPLENPITWIPYGNNNNNDCSQGICNMYCPQWCNYIIYPPPPHFEYPDDDSNPNFSPLVIAIIGILVTIFLLISYYTIISKYCGHRESLSPSHPSNPSVELQEENQNHFSNSSTGLDENLIKSIAVYKYNKKRDFFVGKGISDCSVCLSEFQDGESVRLLPKCNHGFHLPCIDTWLKSQSTCPLCRSSILTFNASNSMVQVPLQPQVIELELPSLENVGVGGENEFGEVQEGNIDDDSIVKASLRAYSDLSNLHRIRDEMYESIRSVSLDHSFQSGVSVAHHHVLNVNEVEDSSMEVGSSKRLRGESSKSSYKRRVLHCVMSPIAMKRSFSSGRFSFGKIDRGKQGIMLVLFFLDAHEKMTLKSS